MTTPDPEFLHFALFNGSLMAAEALQVSPLAAGFMFGEGLFETVRVHASRPIFLDAHHARLASSLRGMAASPVSSSRELRDRCSRMIAANGLAEGSLKIVVFRDVAGWSEIIVARAKTYAPRRYDAGFRLLTTRCGARTDPIHRMKTLNYLPNIQARRHAIASGFDEALFVDPRKRVLEGAMTNVFIVKGGAVMTPSLQHYILPGIARAMVIRLHGSHAFHEADITIEEMYQADEVFVTNALLGIMPVARVDAIDYDCVNNTVTRELMASLRVSQDALGEASPPSVSETTP